MELSMDVDDTGVVHNDPNCPLAKGSTEKRVYTVRSLKEIEELLKDYDVTYGEDPKTTSTDLRCRGCFKE